MANGFGLPPEGYAHILSFLRIPDILAFRSVCKHFDAVVEDNSATIFRQAAILHGYISTERAKLTPSIVSEEPKLSPNSASIRQHWREFCKTRWKIDQGWREGRVLKDCSFRSPDASLSKICPDGEFLLLPRSRDGFHPLYTGPNAHSYRDRQAAFQNAVRTSTSGTLRLSNDGFFLFEVRQASYELWLKASDSTPRPHHPAPGEGVAPSDTPFSFTDPDGSVDAPEFPQEIVYDARLDFLGRITLDGLCRSMKMKEECLMMVSEHNTLYIFDLSVFQRLDDTVKSVPPVTPGQDADDGINRIQPTTTADISDHFNYGMIPDTACIDFDAKYIFHCTQMGFRVLSRENFRVVYSIRDVPWLKVEAGRWARSPSTNTFFLALPEPSRNYPTPRWFTSAPVIPKRSHVIEIRKGISKQRRYQSWSWDACDIYVDKGMIVIGYSGGWLLGFPDYQKLIDGTLSLEDEKACWVLDLARTRCDGVSFDGRRVVCKLPNYFVILNLHEIYIERGLNVFERTVTAGSTATCVEHDETLAGTSGSMVLTERDIWVLALETRGSTGFRLLGWTFAD
ncbi:hypothetical protein FRC16_011276 [Serendipita sp. 398]|nr:hypothetical protein FRC16_011276 [Serendipita sp. 398]